MSIDNSRNGDGQGLYNLCKRFGSLYYGVIDNCLNKRDIVCFFIFINL